MNDVREASLKKKFVSRGILEAEMDAFLKNILEPLSAGYTGFVMRHHPEGFVEIIPRVVNTSKILGEHGRTLREITSLIEQRFDLKGKVRIFAERVNRSLSAPAQCENIRIRLLAGMTVKRCANIAVRNIMEAGAQGVEVVISGKVKGQRAKALKFTSGLMIHAGNAVRDYIEDAHCSVSLRLGVLGIYVKIMKPHDPTGLLGPSKPLPDVVKILEPKEEEGIDDIPCVKLEIYPDMTTVQPESEPIEAEA